MGVAPVVPTAPVRGRVRRPEVDTRVAAVGGTPPPRAVEVAVRQVSATVLDATGLVAPGALVAVAGLSRPAGLVVAAPAARAPRDGLALVEVLVRPSEPGEAALVVYRPEAASLGLVRPCPAFRAAPAVGRATVPDGDLAVLGGVVVAAPGLERGRGGAVDEVAPRPARLDTGLLAVGGAVVVALRPVAPATAVVTATTTVPAACPVGTKANAAAVATSGGVEVVLASGRDPRPVAALGGLGLGLAGRVGAGVTLAKVRREAGATTVVDIRPATPQAEAVEGRLHASDALLRTDVGPVDGVPVDVGLGARRVRQVPVRAHIVVDGLETPRPRRPHVPVRPARVVAARPPGVAGRGTVRVATAVGTAVLLRPDVGRVGPVTFVVAGETRTAVDTEGGTLVGAVLPRLLLQVRPVVPWGLAGRPPEVVASAGPTVETVALVGVHAVEGRAATDMAAHVAASAGLETAQVGVPGLGVGLASDVADVPVPGQAAVLVAGGRAPVADVRAPFVVVAVTPGNTTVVAVPEAEAAPATREDAGVVAALAATAPAPAGADTHILAAVTAPRPGLAVLEASAVLAAAPDARPALDPKDGRPVVPLALGPRTPRVHATTTGLPRVGTRTPSVAEGGAVPLGPVEVAHGRVQVLSGGDANAGLRGPVAKVPPRAGPAACPCLAS